MMYRGELVDGFAKPGIESLETQLYSEADIPWNKLAFPVIKESLQLYFADKHDGQFRVYNGEMHRDESDNATTEIYPI